MFQPQIRSVGHDLNWMIEFPASLLDDDDLILLCIGIFSFFCTEKSERI